MDTFFFYLQHFGITAFQKLSCSVLTYFSVPGGPPASPPAVHLAKAEAPADWPTRTFQTCLFTCTPLLLPNYPQVRGVLHYPEAQGLLMCQSPNERAERCVPYFSFRTEKLWNSNVHRAAGHVRHGEITYSTWIFIFSVLITQATFRSPCRQEPTQI